MSKSSGERADRAWRRRSDFGDPAGLSAASNASIDIVRPGSHSRTITFQSGQRSSDPRPDPGTGGCPGVVQLVGTVDREEIGGRPGDPHEVRRAVDVDPVVAVGQAAADRLDLRPGDPARPGWRRPRPRSSGLAARAACGPFWQPIPCPAGRPRPVATASTRRRGARPDGPGPGGDHRRRRRRHEHRLSPGRAGLAGHRPASSGPSSPRARPSTRPAWSASSARA